MGLFGNFGANLGSEEFAALVVDQIRQLLLRGGDAFTLIAERSDTGMRAPMGAVTMEPAQAQMWPHVYWFPWASARNRIECSVRFLNEMKERFNLVVVSIPKDVDFFQHLCRYGVLRRIGSGRGWLGDMDVMLYETVRRYADDGLSRGPRRAG